MRRNKNVDKRMNGSSFKTWQDLYYDGEVEFYHLYCEETGDIVTVKEMDGWDSYDDLEEDDVDWDD